ncbi:sensor histidine kinase [Streptomyces poonensis]|nr:sensor histidine kinase [Streptomyces poonensis]
MIVRRARRWLGMLRDDLWTVRADPLPPSVWLRWLPHGLVCLVALGIAIGDTGQLSDHGSIAFGYAFPLALVHGGAVVLALWRPIPGWWLATGTTVLVALAVRSRMLSGSAHGFPWPWTAAGIIAQLLVLLLLALRVPTRVSVEALALTVLATLVLQALGDEADHEPTGVAAIVLSAVVVVLGIALRGRREARAELGRQTTLTAEERARRTLLEERSRIARELHDVVAHHMSVISIQAQVAPHLVKDPPEELKENLAGIRQNALEALTELRRVLGVLRSEQPDTAQPFDGPATATAGGTALTTGTAPHAPQPTLDRLGALVENTRAAGLTVTVGTTGERRPLPPGVELSAYRIVQEALSNVLRHAPGATARIHLTHLAYGLRVEVRNTRPRRRVPRSPGAGHGLLGMRERTTMLGGTLATSPTPDGGFQVSAFLPVDAPGIIAAPVPTDAPVPADATDHTAATAHRPPDPEDDTA